MTLFDMLFDITYTCVCPVVVWCCVVLLCWFDDRQQPTPHIPPPPHPLPVWCLPSFPSSASFRSRSSVACQAWAGKTCPALCPLLHAPVAQKQTDKQAELRKICLPLPPAPFPTFICPCMLVAPYFAFSLKWVRWQWWQAENPYSTHCMLFFWEGEVSQWISVSPLSLPLSFLWPFTHIGIRPF